MAPSEESQYGSPTEHPVVGTLNDVDKKWLKSNCGKVERIGLYIMVFYTFMRSCGDVTIRSTTDAVEISQGTNHVARIEK